MGLPRFRDPASMEVTIKRQLDRIDSTKLLFDSPALIGARNDSGSDRGADWPNLEAQPAKSASVDSDSRLNARQPGYSYHYSIPPVSETRSSTPAYFRSKRYRFNFPVITMDAPMGGVSPSRSPRLPSPPPFPEVQIGPKSPSFNPEQSAAVPENSDTTKSDNGAMRRIRPGTKAADMASGPPLVPLAELDSPFQLQEHLKALYHHHTKPPSSNITIPINHDTAFILANPPDNVDRSLWLYELCRFLVHKANNLIVAFFAEEPPCSSKTCPEMRASEWQYLCAVHDPPKACCAIDYCCHTLDWAANVLTSQKHFPSRLTLGTESAGGAQQSVRQLTNIFRRVYRIFAHAWFQHRQVFWQVEGNEGLYILFKKVCDVYNLIQEDNYTISPEAEGIAASKEEAPESGMAILKKQAEEEEPKQADEDTTTTISTGATTRRHKHTPSTGSVVPTIAEGDEEDNHHQSPAKTKDPSAEVTLSSILQAPPETDRAQLQAPPAEPLHAPEIEAETSKGAADEEENLKDTSTAEETKEETKEEPNSRETDQDLLNSAPDEVQAAEKEKMAEADTKGTGAGEAKTEE